MSIKWFSPLLVSCLLSLISQKNIINNPFLLAYMHCSFPSLLHSPYKCCVLLDSFDQLIILNPFSHHWLFIFPPYSFHLSPNQIPRILNFSLHIFLIVRPSKLNIRLKHFTSPLLRVSQLNASFPMAISFCNMFSLIQIVLLNHNHHNLSKAPYC